MAGVWILPARLRVPQSIRIEFVTALDVLFAAYILRAATIARNPVSVGPFIPSKER